MDFLSAARVLFRPSPAQQPSVVYGAVLVAREPGHGVEPAAAAFLDLLLGPEARTAFEQHGFIAPGA